MSYVIIYLIISIMYELQPASTCQVWAPSSGTCFRRRTALPSTSGAARGAIRDPSRGRSRDPLSASTLCAVAPFTLYLLQWSPLFFFLAGLFWPTLPGGRNGLFDGCSGRIIVLWKCWIVATLLCRSSQHITAHAISIFISLLVSDHWSLWYGLQASGQMKHRALQLAAMERFRSTLAQRTQSVQCQTTMINHHALTQTHIRTAEVYIYIYMHML